MTHLGYTLSSEEHGPTELVEYAQRAEGVGFDFLSVSDHYHPWTAQQGNAPFVWNVLGGVAAATEGIDVGVGVTCPTMRIHPAIVAQAAATTQAMLPGEFYFGVGTGENLNEHIIGEQWPEHGVRLDMLEEAVDVIRSLWAGGQQSHHGEHYTVENARLFTLPDSPPPVVASAFGEHTARAVADWADGFWTVGPQGELLDAYREAGGEGPAFAQLSVCYAETEAEAVETAIRNWPNTLLPGELPQELPTPQHFEQACQLVDAEDMRDAPLLTDPDPDAHIELLQEAFDQGFDHVYVHQVGPDQDLFFERYESEILPSL
ncbi:TIGR03557 family F420-dependent LLM class oxidoreductase [Halohasta litorea]|uniref:TIGR03557 family F420-dependent LLM class oxidoreductase n=1 Tax=Halohasta litorea TaxID=869891 RepID=A0ABD6D9Y9_9EURY|nr:TIGR03557 family F420-dependent LLM class oxidoreductase [Halohasta litorea]